MPQTTCQRGKLLSLEGIECSGKGTQSKKIIEFLLSHQIDIRSGHEPGGTAYGEALRALIKVPELAIASIHQAVNSLEDFKDWQIDPTESFDRNPATELLLFMASRADFYNRQIDPILAGGHHLLLDRGPDSSRAYQGGGHYCHNKNKLNLIDALNSFAFNGFKPHLTFFIDITVDEMYKRMSSQSAEKNSFFEQRYPREFYQRVREGFYKIANEEPSRFLIIDGNQSIDEVFGQIRPHLDKLFAIN